MITFREILLKLHSFLLLWTFGLKTLFWVNLHLILRIQFLGIVIWCSNFNVLIKFELWVAGFVFACLSSLIVEAVVIWIFCKFGFLFSNWSWSLFLVFITFSPFAMLIEFWKQEFLCLIIINSNIFKVLVDSILLVIQSFNVLSQLINTDLQSVVLCILIVHCQKTLIILLKVTLILFVEKLVLSNLDSILVTWIFLFFSSDDISALNHFACIFSQYLPREKSSKQNECS